MVTMGLENEQWMGIGLMALGWILFVFGYKFKDIVVSFFGSAFGAALVYFLSLHVPISFACHITLSFITSLILSFISMRFKKIPATILGFITAVCISNLTMGLIQSPSIQQITIGFYFIAFPLLFGSFPFAALLHATSFYGAWIFVSGIDVFLKTGFPNTYTLAVDPNWAKYINCQTSVFLLGLLTISIFSFSFFVQYYLINQLHEKKSEVCMNDDEESALSSSEEDNVPSVSATLDFEGDAPYFDPTTAPKIDKYYLKEGKVTTGEVDRLI
eukprot:gene457-547_t